MKKSVIVFLSLFLFISAPFAAHANIVTATGKYLINAIKHVPGGAQVNATNTVTGAKHVIKHGVSSADLGKGIGAGIVGMAVGSGVGLAFQAITGLALDAVDFIMDPTNNQVKFKLKADGGGDSSFQYLWESYDTRKFYSSPAAACKDFIRDYGKPTGSYAGDPSSVGVGGYLFCYMEGSTSTNHWITKRLNPNYNPLNDMWQKIPLNDLAAKTIELADGGEVLSQNAIEEYVTNLAKEGKLDAELDAATDITPPEGTEPDDPTKPDDKECPLGSVLVDDVCVVKSDSDEALWCNSTDFSKKICDWIDWTQEEPTESVVKPVDIKDVEAENSNKIDMSGECPAPYELNFSVLGYEQNHSISYEPLCGALVMLKPIFVGSGALSGMFILMGYSRASNTGVNG